MLGMVLAAGAGRRLRPYTETLPKALVPVDGETTILDIALGNLAKVDLTDVVIVVGYCAGAVEERKAELEGRYGVERTLLAGRGPDVLLAVDDLKRLADEEMKVVFDGNGHLQRITKMMDPALANGEYIGATLLEPAAAEPLADALKATWERDPSRYYEDRLPGAARPRRQDLGCADRRCRLGRGRQPRRSGEGPPDRQGILMPLFTTHHFGIPQYRPHELGCG